MTLKYRILSDEEFKELGWDPSFFPFRDNEEDPPDGPYTAALSDGSCPCCSHFATGWTVIDLSTGLGISTTHYGDNAQCDAEEDAMIRNAAWLEGWAALDAQNRAGAVAVKEPGAPADGA